MRKVLHLTLYLDIGGLERMIFLLSQKQKAKGWEPSVFVYERETGDLSSHFARENIPVTFFRKGPGFSPRLLFRILAHLKQQGITLVHSHDLGALIYASLVRLLSGGRIQIVHTQHSFQHLQSPKIRLYERIFPWLANRLVCVSEDLRRTYLKLGQPVERLRLVPNGVDFSVHPAARDKRRGAQAKLLNKHGFPAELAGRPWIITLGRLARVKGPHHALAAWNLVARAEAERAAFLMVGPEWEPGLLASLRAQAKNPVHFAGPTLDPQAWLSAADLFFSASEFEGLPMAALEAAANRLPMLLSEIPGHALFRGWAAYFPLAQPIRAAEQIEKFLATGGFGAHTGGAEVFKQLQTSGGAERMAERYLRVYEEIYSPR